MKRRAKGDERVFGRELQLDEVTRSLSAARRGKAQFILFGGEGGVGKTLLANCAEEKAGRAGFEVVTCRFEELTPTGPFNLWVTLIRIVLSRTTLIESSDRTVDKVCVEAALGARWGVLCRLLGEEERSRFQLPPVPIEDQAFHQNDIVDALVAFVRQLARRRRLLIVVEDLHLADEESVSLLPIVASQLDGIPVVFLITYRTTVPSVRAGALADTLSALSRRSNAVNLELSRLDGTSAREMMAASGISMDRETMDGIYSQSEGNPLLISELLELVRIGGRIESGSLYPASATNLRVQANVASRLTPISREFRLALVQAAVVGREFTASQIAGVVRSLTFEEIDQCMQSAQRLGIVEEVSQRGPGPRWRFLHGIIREAVLNLVGPADRRRITALVARRLEEYYGENAESHSDELFPHFLASEDAADLDKGIHYALSAAEAALTRFAWKRALSILNRLAGEFEGALTAEERARTYLGLGIAHNRSDNRIVAATFLTRAFAYYRGVADMDRLVEIALLPVDLELGDDYQFPLIEQAITAVPECHGRYLELKRAYLHGLLQSSGRYEEADRFANELLCEVRSTGNRALETRLLVDIAYLHTRLSRFDETISVAEELLARSMIEPNVIVKAHAHFHLMQAHLLRGEVGLARENARISRDTILVSGDKVLVAAGIAHAAAFALREGEWTVLRVESDRGIDEDPRNAVLLSFRAIAEYYQGEISQGDRYLERLIDVALSYPTPCALPHASVVLLLAHRRTMTAEKKYLMFARKLTADILAANPVPAIEVRARLAQTLTAVEDKKLEEAGALYRRLSEMNTYNLLREYRVERALALLSRAVGNFDRSAGHFLDAVSSSRKYRDLPSLAWILAEYGDLLADPNSSGSHADALRAYQESLRLALRLQMGPLAGRVEAALQQLRTAGRHVGQRQLGRSLTERERQVLRHAGEGKTDREISLLLGISTYTVSNHVRHVLAKTGSENRLEAFRYAESMGIL